MIRTLKIGCTSLFGLFAVIAALVTFTPTTAPPTATDPSPPLTRRADDLSTSQNVSASQQAVAPLPASPLAEPTPTESPPTATPHSDPALAIAAITSTPTASAVPATPTATSPPPTLTSTTAPTQPPATPTPTPAGTTVLRNANLRGGPGTDYPVIGTRAGGARLTVVAVNPEGDWLLLDDGAWIAAFLVEPVTGLPVVSPTTAPRPPPTATLSPVPTQPPALPAPIAGSLTVHYLDVGQGDSTLLLGPDFTILIDAGRHDRNDVVPHLERLGVTHIDLLIATHPHADHIGQMDRVVRRFSVTEVWMSGATTTSQTFERVLDAIVSSDAGYHEPRAGETQVLGSARIEVLNPVRVSSDVHESGIALRIRFGDVFFLFTGDIETGTEAAMIARGHDLRAHILQLGHHGSRTSTSPAFLQAVQPSLAIWSASATNQYGHPHAEVVDRIAAASIATYGTALHGSITVTTDGSTFAISTATSTAAQTLPPAQAPPAQALPPAPTQPPTAVPTLAPPAPPVANCVNINTASVQELQAIIHIGPARAEAMIGQRPFRSVADMTRISGIGPARLADIQSQGLACVY